MQIPSRTSRLILAVLVGALATASVASAQKTPAPPAKAKTETQASAQAKTPVKAPPSTNCAKAIVDDWYPDGDVDYLYPLPCYQKAIKSLPQDLKEYSQAPDDILRAYRFAKRNRPDPGRGTTKPVPTDSVLTTTDAEPTPRTDTTSTTETDFGGHVTGNDGGPGGSGGGTTDGQPAGTSDSSSVPVPLIVLGGLAALLFAAGGAGYLSRRTRGQAPPDGDAESSPDDGAAPSADDDAPAP